MITLNDLVSIDETGYHYADYPTFLQYEIEGYQGIYGADTVLTPQTQDGQRLASQAQAKYDTAAKGAMTYLSFSPASAQGTGLSRVVKINGLERDDPGFSTVDVDIVGTANTTIVDGVAIDTLQQQWVLPTPITIPGGGTITVTATAKDEGAINALPSTVTGIFTPTLGWQTVNNPAAATAGAPIEADGQLRQRQSVSTSLPAQTVFAATLAAVANVTGVTASKGYENDDDTTDANTLPPHSIAIVAKGGTDVAVATAIQIKKTPGTNTYGTTAVPLTDSEGVPITINFFRPTDAEIGVEVTLTALAGFSNDYKALIQDAVSAAVLAVPIGGLVVLTKLFLAAYLPGTPAYGTYDITLIRIKKNAGSFGTSNIQLTFVEIPVCDPSTDVVILP